MKNNIVEKISDSLIDLEESLLNNPLAWNVSYSADLKKSVVNVRFEHRTDRENPNQLVLYSDKLASEITPAEIAKLIKDRNLVDNKEIHISVSDLIAIQKSVYRTLNADVTASILDLAANCSKLKKNVLQNPILDSVSLATSVEGKTGASIASLGVMKEFAWRALAVNTSGDGICALHKSEHVINNLSTKSGRRVLLKHFPEMVSRINELDRKSVV